MPAPTPCPGLCNASWRRAEQLGQPHTIQPRSGEPIHCWQCFATAHTELAQLRTLFVSIYLEGLHGTPTKLVGTIGRTSIDARAPGEHARLFADGIVDGLLILANDTREQLGEYVQGRYEGSLTMELSIATLTKHLRWLLGAGIPPGADHHPCADESHGANSGNPAWQIHKLHRSAEAFCKQDEQRAERRMAPCRRCKGPWLATRQGVIECGDPDCRNVMTPDEYATYVRALTEVAKLVETAA